MAWYKYAKPGDKVVAIRDDFIVDPSSQNVGAIKKGNVYEISFVTPEIPNYFGVGLNLKGYVDTFSVAAFRPIQPKSTETGMSTLKGILNGQRVPEAA